MRIITIKSNLGIPQYQAPIITEEQTLVEYEYLMAEFISKQMLVMGIIDQKQFDRVMAINRDSFPTILRRLY